MKRLTGTQSLFQFNSNSNESTQLAQLLCGAQSEKNKGNKKNVLFAFAYIADGWFCLHIKQEK